MLARSSAASRAPCAVARPIMRRAALHLGAAPLFARRALLAGAGLAYSLATGVRAMAAGGGAIPAPADVAAPPANASVTPSGLASVVLKAGNCVHSSSREKRLLPS